MRKTCPTVAMDIFGPPNMTKAGNKYVLEITDHRLQDKMARGISPKNVTTESAINSLIELTSQLRVPEESLSDKGSNFVDKITEQVPLWNSLD